MTTLLTTELIDRCHAGSRAKGFWDETPHPGQQNALIMSELSEALEAHRKGRTADFEGYNFHNEQHLNCGQPDFFYPINFQERIKDSVGDELADAYIRLCDYAGGYGTPISQLIDHYQHWSSRTDVYRDEFSGVFGSDLLQSMIAVIEIDKRTGIQSMPRLSQAFQEVERLAAYYKIDLATHIDLKLRYNATRPAKHGKAY